MDTDKLKEFFIHNFEKMILVVVTLAAGYLIYAGTSKPIFTADNDPDRLKAQANQVRSDIDIDHTENIIPERVPTFDIPGATNLALNSIDVGPYKPPQIWGDQTEGGARIQRQDPLLIPPSDLRLASIATMIAIREDKKNPGYALADLEDADPVEKVEKKPRRSRRSRRNNMDEMMGGEMGMGMGMEGMEMGMDGMGMEMGMGMDGMDSMSSGSNRRLDSAFDFGYRPLATDDGREPIPAVGRFIAGTAVVPYKKLYEAYELALRDNDQYDARRDTPFFYDLEVQRADVTDKPVDQLAEEDWVKLPWNRNLYTQLAALRWSGFAPEIVPQDYRDEALTYWIPPVLLDDYRTFAAHPLVPMIPHKELKALAGDEEDEDDPLEFNIDGSQDLELAAPGETGGGLGGGGDGYDMMDMGMDEGMDGMMMGMGMAMMGRGIERDPVEYKLIRFYDFDGFRTSPKMGRSYVYRIRYAVNDPNFPFLATLQPKISSLSPDAEKRVQALMGQAKKSNSRKELFKRWSEWSQPSAPTSLPDLEKYFVGPVQRGSVSTWSVQGKDVEYARDEPKAKMIASQLDPNTGARIPMQLDVFEGTVLSKKMESADVIDPITLKVKKLPDAEILSATTVIGIDGGVTMPITGEDEIAAPGMMLLFDQDGKLHLNDEIGDMESYRIYSFADEKGE